MTKDEALRLALDTLKEVREETFRLLRNGERLYAEDKVWSTIIAIQETLETKDEPVAWEQFHEHMAGPNYVAPQSTWVGLTKMELIKCGVFPWGMSYRLYEAIEFKLKEKNT